MKNLSQMLKQAQKMQTDMADLQDRLGRMEVAGQSGGGLVRVTLNGKGEMRKVKLDPSLIDPKEAEVLEDLIVAAFADAKAKAEALAAEEMSKIAGGLQLPPGLKLPF